MVAAAILLVAGALSGCSTTSAVRVKPWERAQLADATMNPDRDPLATAMQEHIYFSREAAAGGRGVGGAGCGCN
jgi:predicted component of type VI protein secretion system